MFGCIVAGRPVQTNLKQVDTNKYIFELEDATSINHLVVFTTDPFPVGFGASVHFLWPNNVSNAWVYLGMLNNDKPSAIFRLGGKKSKSTDQLMEEAFAPTSTIIAQLGISIEPINQLQPPMISLKSEADIADILPKLLDNLYNYVMSFTMTQGPDTWIPTKVFQEWYQSTLRKAREMPNFLK